MYLNIGPISHFIVFGWVPYMGEFSMELGAVPLNYCFGPAELHKQLIFYSFSFLWINHLPDLFLFLKRSILLNLFEHMI